MEEAEEEDDDEEPSGKRRLEEDSLMGSPISSFAIMTGVSSLIISC